MLTGVVRNSKGNCREDGCRPGRTCRLLLRTCINCKVAHIQRIQTFQNFNESSEKILSIPSNKAQPESKNANCISLTDVS